MSSIVCFAAGIVVGSFGAFCVIALCYVGGRYDGEER